MGFFHNDIAVDDVATLQALTSSSEPARVQNGLYYVRALDLWFRYDLGGTASGDDIVPGDSLGAFKVGASGSGSGGGSAIIPGYMTCQCHAPFYHTKDYGSDQSHRIGGKAIRILEEGTHSLNIKVATEFSQKLPSPTDITNNGLNANKIIEVHRWSQPPNGGQLYANVINSGDSTQNGREWVADLPATGGTVNVTIDSTYKWISCTAYNFDNSNDPFYNNKGSNQYDTPYLQWFNTTDVWLWTFSDDFDLSPEINATDVYNSFDNGNGGGLD